MDPTFPLLRIFTFNYLRETDNLKESQGNPRAVHHCRETSATQSGFSKITMYARVIKGV